MTAARWPIEYECDRCAARWSYEAVRFVACCPACGGGLAPSHSSDRGAPITTRLESVSPESPAEA